MHDHYWSQIGNHICRICWSHGILSVLRKLDITQCRLSCIAISNTCCQSVSVCVCISFSLSVCPQSVPKTVIASSRKLHCLPVVKYFWFVVLLSYFSVAYLFVHWFIPLFSRLSKVATCVSLPELHKVKKFINASIPNYCWSTVISVQVTFADDHFSLWKCAVTLLSVKIADKNMMS